MLVAFQIKDKIILNHKLYLVHIWLLAYQLSVIRKKNVVIRIKESFKAVVDIVKFLNKFYYPHNLEVL